MIVCVFLWKFFRTVPLSSQLPTIAYNYDLKLRRRFHQNGNNSQECQVFDRITTKNYHAMYHNKSVMLEAYNWSTKFVKRNGTSQTIIVVTYLVMFLECCALLKTYCNFVTETCHMVGSGTKYVTKVAPLIITIILQSTTLVTYLVVLLKMHFSEVPFW